MILVGTNGFRYRDWVPVFYPAGLGPSEWLHYYSRRFGCCELAFSGNRFPEPATVRQLLEESDGALQFIFRIPIHLLQNGPQTVRLAEQFAAALWPVKDAGQLSAVLAQYPADFGFIRDNFRRLCRLRDSLCKIPLITEFGCADWLTLRAARHLARERIALASIDDGRLHAEKTYCSVTPEIAYVRFQGRNRSLWVNGDGSSRHDYLYSREELHAAASWIRRLKDKSERILVLMNNPWRGQAAVNAAMMLEILDECGSR
jgi:uncharacterized protein YecE (DUF72 family)